MAEFSEYGTHHEPELDAPHLVELLRFCDREYPPVEIKQFQSEEWCIRMCVRQQQDELPIAVIGKTLSEAAERLRLILSTVVS